MAQEISLHANIDITDRRIPSYSTLYSARKSIFSRVHQNNTINTPTISHMAEQVIAMQEAQEISKLKELVNF